MISFDFLRKLFFHTRHKGLEGFKKFISLNSFEKKIFSSKKLIWNDKGFWQIDPLPAKDELTRYYSEIYWFNNSSYREILVTKRDLNHYLFLKNQLGKNFSQIKNFLNFGAGHGGISYLLSIGGTNVINIEPSDIYSPNVNNFHTFANLNALDQAKIVNNKKFNFVYSSHVLEHLNNPLDFFVEIFGIMNNDGLLFIEVPNCRRIVEDNYTNGGCNGKKDGSHLIYFTKDFFERFTDKVFFIGGTYDDPGDALDNEDYANFLRVLISKEEIKSFLKRENLLISKS